MVVERHETCRVNFGHNEREKERFYTPRNVISYRTFVTK